jgi:hypothetical protein
VLQVISLVNYTCSSLSRICAGLGAYANITLDQEHI